MRRNSLKAAVLGTMALLVVVSSAQAETTRDQYVVQAEAICKQNLKQNSKILKGVRAQIKKGKTKKASVKFKKAGKAFGAALNRVQALEEPVADGATLSTWMVKLRPLVGGLMRISKALKKNKINSAQRLAVKLQNKGQQANNVVVGYGFSACLIRPGRFQ